MDNSFEGMGPSEFGDHPHDRGEPTQSSRDLAQQAAAEAIHGDYVDEYTLPSEEQEYIDFEGELPAEESYEADEYPQQEPEPSETAYVDNMLTDEDYDTLTELGVDIPRLPENATPEMQELYGNLVQNIINTQYSTQRQVLDAQEAILKVQEINQTLSTEDGQQKLLLNLAMSKPEMFREAAEIVERMQNDPDYSESVRQRMEADERMKELHRKEQAYNATQVRQRARQVENHLVRQARRFGVDTDTAKELVIARIHRNESQTGKRDIQFEEIDQIVSGLAKKMGSRPRVKRPAAHRRETEAPRRPSGPTNRTRIPAPAQPQPVATNSDVMDSLRSAVKDSGRRLRSQGL